MTSEVIRMPRGGIFDADGRPSQAGHRYLAGIQELSERAAPAIDSASGAADVLAGGEKLVRSDSLWATMIPKDETDTFAPDLGARLDFELSVSGNVTIEAPVNVPGDSYPFFSILVVMEVAGAVVSFGPELVGDTPVPLTAIGDRCLMGGKIIGRDDDGTVTEFAMWIIADIAA